MVEQLDSVHFFNYTIRDTTNRFLRNARVINLLEVRANLDL
jgi:hypothetical protein